MRKTGLLAVFMLSLFVFSSNILFCQTFKADDIVGKWWTDKNESIIQIYKKGNKYYGKIIWIKDKVYEKGDKEEGKEKHDRENPDSKLRSRPIVGLEIIQGFKFDGDDEWVDADIYDPESGNTYSCKAWLNSSKNKLDLRGYLGFSLIGRTTTWTRKVSKK
ncbi:MAG: DUF2147 domain-containing protein [Saprospiraceae bacterium]|nr:DUF2147 domain-containing protein [Saprospiraceae bacterium]